MHNQAPTAEVPPNHATALQDALRKHVSEKGGRYWPPKYLEREVLDEIAKRGGEEAMKTALAQAYMNDRPNRRERRRRQQAAERALRRHERKNSGA